jgi:DNA-binding protein
MNSRIITVRTRRDKNKYTTDGIFEFTSGTKTLLIKGEGDEIATAVEVAEDLKRKMYPGIKYGNVSISSYKNHLYGRNRRNRAQNRMNNKFNNKELISRIEIELSMK